MKIGLIVDHLSLRNDIREMIPILSDKCDLRVFAAPSEVELVPKDIECRVMHPLPLCFRNRVATSMYKLFGNLPATRTNYKDYILRRLHKGKPSLLAKIKCHALVNVQVWGLQVIDFSRYISWLKVEPEDLEGVDAVISFTDVNNENMIASVLQLGIPLLTYIHSWDHLAKFRRFSKKSIQYVTWGDSLKQDLHALHGIPLSHIATLAASQYSFIASYLNSSLSDTRPIDQPYIYYAAACGYPIVAAQEVLLVKLLAETMARVLPAMILIFRPYPMLKDWGNYDDLIEMENVRFDDFDQNENVVLTEDDRQKKLRLIRHAHAVVHCGTTIGLEASYFDVPVLYLNIRDIDYRVSTNSKNHIFVTWKQFHLQRYYLLEEYPNVVTCASALESVLSRCGSSDGALLEYNRQLRTISPLVDMDEFVSRLMSQAVS